MAIVLTLALCGDFGRPAAPMPRLADAPRVRCELGHENGVVVHCERRIDRIEFADPREWWYEAYVSEDGTTALAENYGRPRADLRIRVVTTDAAGRPCSVWTTAPTRRRGL